jgi:hypothetical protein
VFSLPGSLNLSLFIIFILGLGIGECNRQACIQDLEPEDQALLGQSMQCPNDLDESDIDDGEFWGDVEESECVNDLPDSDGSAVTVDPTLELADESEERNAASIMKFLTLMIAKWSYRYNNS